MVILCYHTPSVHSYLSNNADLGQGFQGIREKDAGGVLFFGFSEVRNLPTLVATTRRNEAPLFGLRAANGPVPSRGLK